MKAVAVLLLLGSVAVLKIAAANTAEFQGAAGVASKDTHDKHGHGKKYDGYKPNGYKPNGYKYDGYKPDGYKPDGYKEYKYDKDYKPGYGGYEPDHYYGEQPYNYQGYGSPGYENPEYSYGYGGPYNGYDHNAMYGKYGELSPYDGGYWGGPGGRQRIHLQAVYQENLLNLTLVNDRMAGRIGAGQRCSQNNQGPCDMDFALICALRHHESESYGNNDYASGKYGPIFQTPPIQPLAIGLGKANYEPITRNNGNRRAIDDLVIFNGHQVGYTWANVNGYIEFANGAQDCHPLLGANTKVRFNEERVPVYLIVGKVRLPVDPAIALPFGGFDRESTDNLNRKKSEAEVQGDKGNDYETAPEYKTTPEGNKYKVNDKYAYFVNKDDNTLCGLSIVARGPVTLIVNPPGRDNTDRYTGTMEWPIMWSDFITTLPLLLSDRYVKNRQSARQNGPSQGEILPGPYQPFPDFADMVGDQWLEETIDRYAALCRANSDIPWIAPGSFTLDVSPAPAA